MMVCKIGTIPLIGCHSLVTILIVFIMSLSLCVEWFICGLVIEAIHCFGYVLLSWTIVVEPVCVG